MLFAMFVLVSSLSSKHNLLREVTDLWILRGPLNKNKARILKNLQVVVDLSLIRSTSD